MSVYTYPNSSVIDEVTFRTTEQGAVRAYLHAGAGVDEKQIKSILEMFQGNGWQAIPFLLDGKPVLEIRGLKTERKFLELLEKHDWVSGQAQHKKDNTPSLTFKDKLSKRTLQASGLSMAIADMGFIIYGLKEAKMHKAIDPEKIRDLRDALAGLSYFSGSAVLSTYGRNDQSDLQVRDVAHAILNHAKEKGLVVSDDSALQSVGKPRHENVLTKVHNFLREHPSEVGNMAYFTAGLLISWSALQNRALVKPRPEMTAKQIKEMRKGGWGDVALGSTTMLSGLIGTFGKEKAPDPNAPEKTGLAKFGDHLMRNPLAIAGLGYIGSTLCHAYTTKVEYKEALRAVADKTLSPKEHKLALMKKDAVPWRVLFIGATLLGEVLLTMSSKGHGEGVQIDNTVDQSIYAITADLIARQPAHLQNGLVDYMAGYIADPKILGGNRQKIAEKLHADIDAIRHNPWALGVTQENSKPSVPNASVDYKSEAKTAWQSKIAVQAGAAGQQPQPSI